MGRSEWGLLIESSDDLKRVIDICKKHNNYANSENMKSRKKKT